MTTNRISLGEALDRVRSGRVDDVLIRHMAAIDPGEFVRLLVAFEQEFTGENGIRVWPGKAVETLRFAVYNHPVKVYLSLSRDIRWLIWALSISISHSS